MAETGRSQAPLARCLIDNCQAQVPVTTRYCETHAQEYAGRSWTGVARQVPLLVTVTREHVVWIDVDPDEEAASVAACWVEEPYDLLTDLDDRNASDIGWQVQYDPSHHLVQRGPEFVGPTFPSGAWSSAEEERYQDYLRRLPQPTDAARSQHG